MWELYEELIAGIPENLSVKTVVAGNFWTCVESELGVGTAVTIRSLTRPPMGRFKLEGASLKQVAALAKSWNFVEVGIGVAAINAYYNTPEIAENNSVLFSQGDDRLNDPYIAYRNFARDKKVGSIGSHSDTIEQIMGDIAEITEFGDTLGCYPIQAAEYLLPEQDLVYLPCTAEITKELPRYLELCKNTVAIVCGPSITMSPTLFKYGVFDMAGFVVTDSDMAFESASGTAVKKMFAAGKKAALRRDKIQNLR